MTDPKPDDIQCPVCGYYCLGNGGLGCIDKPGFVKKLNLYDKAVEERRWSHSRANLGHNATQIVKDADAAVMPARDALLNEWRKAQESHAALEAEVERLRKENEQLKAQLLVVTCPKCHTVTHAKVIDCQECATLRAQLEACQREREKLREACAEVVIPWPEPSPLAGQGSPGPLFTAGMLAQYDADCQRHERLVQPIREALRGAMRVEQFIKKYEFPLLIVGFVATMFVGVPLVYYLKEWVLYWFPLGGAK